MFLFVFLPSYLYLCTLDNFVSDSNRVTSLELWELLAGCKCFFSNFN